MLELHIYTVDKFDYLEGELGGDYEYALGDQLKRAQSLLRGRTNEEIEYGMESLDWMLKEGGKYLWDEIKDEEESFISRVKALKALVPHIELDEQEQLINAKWYEYFAILTIAYVGEMIYEYKSIAKRKGDGRVDISGILYDWPIEAMDAVCYAEHLAEMENYVDKVKKEINREKGAKGGRLRASKFSKIKRLVVNEYLGKYESRSNRDAAKRIYKDYKEEFDLVLTGDEPEKTIEKWIGAYKREQLSD